MKNQPCYDKDGNFLGWFSRSMATATFIFCKDSDGDWCMVASERGSGAADYQGYWNTVCGYLDFGERLTECSVRETMEEVGLKLDEKNLNMEFISDSPTNNHQNVEVIYSYIIKDKKTDDFSFSKEKNEKDEVGDIRWIKVSDIGKYKWAFHHGEIAISIFVTKMLGS